MISYRTGTLTDLPACRNLINRIWPEEIIRFEAEYELFLKRCDVFDTYVGLAEDDGRIVGMSMLYRANMAFDLLAMDWLAVLPDYRNKGIGIALTEKRLVIADTQKMPTVLSTDRPEFFRRFGFQNKAQSSSQYCLLYRPVNGTA